MVILSPSTRVSDEFECEVLEAPEADKNKYVHVRPCERYDELYRSCKSIRSRFAQYYVYGELLDCTNHLLNYKNCLEFRRTGNFRVLDPIVEWETDIIKTRMNTVNQNNTWQFRETPPSEFSAPIPEFLAKRQKSSLFQHRD